MEADLSALMDDFLSPPFLCWLARDGLWTHPGLIPVWGGCWTLLPWSARAVFLSAAGAGVLVAGSLLYCRLRRARRGGSDSSDAEKECSSHKVRQRNTLPARDQGGSNHYDYHSPPPQSPLTPMVTIFPSRYRHPPPPPTSPPYTSPFIEGTDGVESERAVISFLDSDDEAGEHETTPITETTPLAPPTTTGNQATVEFSLSYTGGSDHSDEEEGRALTWRPGGGHQEEIISQTIVTAL
ncbi:hypothetical protein GBAR_LOCUS25904 [Geodia barretti]|uniref:Uncharacterized protein n=1 Tax=Geodia barretti TaxID=519541 RepID=A0AA35TF59_GEOBA|nr:hypothetical protein GBAR_LOCUS25904 [Geodia barretti]